MEKSTKDTIFSHSFCASEKGMQSLRNNFCNIVWFFLRLCFEKIPLKTQPLPPLNDNNFPTKLSSKTLCYFSQSLWHFYPVALMNHERFALSLYFNSNIFLTMINICPHFKLFIKKWIAQISCLQKGIVNTL